MEFALFLPVKMILTILSLDVSVVLTIDNKERGMADDVFELAHHLFSRSLPVLLQVKEQKYPRNIRS